MIKEKLNISNLKGFVILNVKGKTIYNNHNDILETAKTAVAKALINGDFLEKVVLKNPLGATLAALVFDNLDIEDNQIALSYAGTYSGISSNLQSLILTSQSNISFSTITLENPEKIDPDDELTILWKITII